MEHEYMNREFNQGGMYDKSGNFESHVDLAGGISSGAATGAAIGSAVPVVGTAIGTVVGAVGGAVASFFGKKTAAPATAQFQADMLALRNALIVQPNLTISDILTYNDKIDANFQALDQVATSRPNLPYSFYLYYKNPASVYDRWSSDANKTQHWKGLYPPYAGHPVTYHDIAISNDKGASFINVENVVTDADIKAVADAKGITVTTDPKTGLPVTVTAGSGTIGTGTYVLIGLLVVGAIFFAMNLKK